MGGGDKCSAQRGNGGGGDTGTGVFQDAQIGPIARAEGLGKTSERQAALGIGVRLCQFCMP